MSRRKQALRLSLVAGLAAAACFAVLAIYAEIRLSRLVLGGLGESFSTRVYSAPYVIHSETSASPERLIERLNRLKYRKALGSPSEKGEYSWEPPTLAVYLRGFELPHLQQRADLYFLTAKAAGAWEISAADGSSAATVALEPEIAAELSGAEKIRREPMSAGEVPDLLKKAVISVEDKRFYSHWGIDPRAIARAFWYNLTGRRGLHGGSTITQQLAKNYFLSAERTLKRKLADALLALYLEFRYSKDELLTLYLNHIYMGQDGFISVAGMKAAAQFYFGKELKELTLGQCALLAGIIRSPYRYNPWREPNEAVRRRNLVLSRMLTEGHIDPARQQAALLEPLALRVGPSGRQTQQDANTYYVSEVVRQTLAAYGEDALFRYGLQIHTTMDPLLQAAAQKALKQTKYQGALVAMDAETGALLAVAGGKEFRESQFNRATQALRQPGSAFKPFVFGAALEDGWTAARLLQDKPRKYKRADGSPWTPKNFDGVYRGTATLRTAFALSLNAAAVELAEKVGPSKIVAFARRAGIRSYVEESLAAALGSSEVTLLELTAAYAPFANGGSRVAPQPLTAVLSAEGNVLEYHHFEREKAMEESLAYLVTSLLETAVQEGTGKVLKAFWQWERPTAGKTGTTNGGRDAWFIGYTPRILAGVWVGDDQNKERLLSGAKDAIPIWAAFMKQADGDGEAKAFERPAGIVEATVDPSTDKLARTGCPERLAEIFVNGTQPTESCEAHAGGIKGLFRRWLGE